MKKLVYLLSCLFLLSAGFVACSNDTDDPPEQPSSHQNEEPTDSIGGFEEDSALLEPEFSEEMGNNPRYANNNQTTTEENGMVITRDAFGYIKWISFSSAIRPTTATELFSQYMGLSPDDYQLYYKEDNSWMSSPLTVERYHQLYRGIAVNQGTYIVRFQNGSVTDANGNYIKVEGLDITPSFDVQTAKEIYAKYLNVLVDRVGTRQNDDALMIAEFPVKKGSSEWAPRLVYCLHDREMNDEGSCFIDAHTGRILQTWCNYTDELME